LNFNLKLHLPWPAGHLHDGEEVGVVLGPVVQLEADLVEEPVGVVPVEGGACGAGEVHAGRPSTGPLQAIRPDRGRRLAGPCGQELEEGLRKTLDFYMWIFRSYPGLVILIFFRP